MQAIANHHPAEEEEDLSNVDDSEAFLDAGGVMHWILR